MLKKKLLFLLGITILLTQTSCNDHELDSLAIVTCAIYDQTDDDKISITYEIIDPQLATSSSDNQKHNTHVITGTGKTAPEAVSNITQFFSRNLYTQFVAARIYHENYAKSDISNTLDYTLRMNKIRESAYMMVLKDENSENLFKSSKDLDKNIHEFITKLAQSQKTEVNHSVFIKTTDFCKAYYQEGREPITGILEVIEKKESLSDIKDEKQKEKKPSNSEDEKNKEDKKDNEDESKNKEDDKKYTLSYKGIAVFKDSKMVGQLDENETRSYNIISGKLKNAIITLPYEDGNIDIIASRCNTKIETKFENDSVIITINPTFKINISDNSSDKDVFDVKVSKEIQTTFNEFIKEEIINTIKKVQGYESDIFAFGEYFHNQNYQMWTQIRNNWNEYFKNAQIEVNVKSTIQNIGAITSSKHIKKQ